MYNCILNKFKHHSTSLNLILVLYYRYKPNILYVDDASSSSIVDTAIEANRGDIKREVTIAMQGSCRHGYYDWEGFTAVGGRDGFNCTEIQTRYCSFMTVCIFASTTVTQILMEVLIYNCVPSTLRYPHL